MNIDSARLLQIIRQSAPDWIGLPEKGAALAMLQTVIDQCLPGLLGIKIIEIAAGQIHGTCAYSKKTTNVIGYMHGATIFALGDTLAGALLWCMLPPDYFAVTASARIRYIRPLSEGALFCTVKAIEPPENKTRLKLIAHYQNEQKESVAGLDMQYRILPQKKSPES